MASTTGWAKDASEGGVYVSVEAVPAGAGVAAGVPVDCGAGAGGGVPEEGADAGGAACGGACVVIT